MISKEVERYPWCEPINLTLQFSVSSSLMLKRESHYPYYLTRGAKIGMAERYILSERRTWKIIRGHR